MNKFLKLGLSLVLCLTLYGCTNTANNNEDNKEFTKYLDSLPELLVGNNTTFINSLFDEPEKYGIEPELYELEFISYDDYQESIKDIKGIKKKLETFKYDALSKEQQMSYDVLMAFVDIEEENKDFYYLSTNYFDVNSGVQSNLPLELWVYEFKNQLALDSFVSILKSTPEMFEKYIALELERQEKGYGMSKTYLDDVIEGFRLFNEGDHNYIIETANQKIDALDFIDDSEKQQYKADILTAYENDFLPSYVYAQQELEKIQPKGDEDASLADYKHGKDYYEYLIESYTGFDSVEDYSDFLDEQEEVIYKSVMAIYPEISKLEEEDLLNAKYTDIDNINDLLKYLEKEVDKGDSFPKLSKLDYHMEVVPIGLQDIFQAAAAYFLSPYDNLEAKEKMILNGEYSQQDFNSVAHEGFPGHMYQHNYFKTVDHHIVRDLLSNLGYVEGWATYAASEACAYAEDRTVCEVMEVNNDLTYLYILRADLMIHYENASRQDIYDYFKQNFGLEEEALVDTYEQLLENPAIFTTYYGGKYQLVNLKEEAKDAWKDDYSDLKFNEAILNLGPMPYDVLTKYMEEQFK